MSRKIFLHVGTEKTGSTSIQTMLHNNHQLLQKKGFYLPQTIGHPCHINLTACALGSIQNHPIRRLFNITDDATFATYKAETINDLMDELGETSCEKILISDEHINSHLVRPNLMEDYAKILQLIGSVEKIFIYLRRQDLFRLSLFSEAVKAGNLKAFDIDNPLIPFKVIPNRFNYARILKRLSDVFGKEKIIVRLFRKNELVGGDAVIDYLSHVNLDPRELDLTSQSRNSSLDSTIIKPLAEVTETLKKDPDPLSEEIRQHMVNRVRAAFQGKGPIMHPKSHTDFLKKFEDINQSVKTLYFSDRTAPLFEPVAPLSDTATYYPSGSLSVREMTEELNSREKIET